MKSTLIWALVVLNTALALSLLNRYMSPNVAQAQAVRRPGDYLTIPGEISGGQTGLVYVLDTTTSELTALSFDDNSKKVVSMPKLDLKAIFAQGGKR